MKFLSTYKNLRGYLHRFTLIKCGRLHIRLHRILIADGTPFQHSHPFNYISLILSGGYREKVNQTYLNHTRFSLIFRDSNVTHQIVEVMPGTVTLFITWTRKDKQWKLERTGDTPETWFEPKPGIYSRTLYGVKRLSKFDGFWHQAAADLNSATAQHRPSIDQTTQGKLVLLFRK